MDTRTEQVPNPEVEKLVEITILQRKIVAIEHKRAKFLSWIAFAIVALIGAIFGSFIILISFNYDINYTVYNKMTDTLAKSNYPTPIIYNYEHENNYYNYLFDSKYEDTLINIIEKDKLIYGQEIYDSLNNIKLSKFSKSEVDTVNNRFDNLKEEIKSETKKSEIKKVFKSTVYGILVSISLYSFFIAIYVFLWKTKINKIKLELNAIGAKELKQNLDTEAGEDFFTQLVKINFKYLDQYYLQTEEQADKSFWISEIVSIIGFIIIIIGIVLMCFREQHDAGYMATSAGILSEFISAVFFYLYNKTILKMSEYHQKLVLTQNISLALKTADLLKIPKKKKRF